MSTFLFDKIVFGPVKSRRLGVSLGINLLPVSRKLCNFDCIYCECGWSHLHSIRPEDIPTRNKVARALRDALLQMRKDGKMPDVITFAGNGEPTMHAAFKEIVDDTVGLRNELSPKSKISLLSNAVLLDKPNVREALYNIDINILKLDTAVEETFLTINKPAPGISLQRIIQNLIAFDGQKTLQTLFLRGTGPYSDVDNTTPEEINALIEAFKKIRPDSIMVYTYYRDTPTEHLQKVPAAELKEIAGKIERAGFQVELTVD